MQESNSNVHLWRNRLKWQTEHDPQGLCTLIYILQTKFEQRTLNLKKFICRVLSHRLLARPQKLSPEQGTVRMISI